MAALRVDFRSDTVTQPTPGMRAAMAAAEVGDDHFGEDPTVQALQARVASLLGKEAALWVPTGTMANQVALRVLTRPGDEVVVPREAHTAWLEAGASAANAGVQFREIGRDGVFSTADLDGAVNPRGQIITPPTTLLAVENTHNRAGGVAWPPAQLRDVAETAARLGLSTYMDGARLWNAAVATETPEAVLAAPFDLVSVCLSKGLGAPAGSVVAGTRETIALALRARKMLGGQMRQVGVLAAAGLYALEHHRPTLADDHAHARLVAETLGQVRGVALAADGVQTNIVLVRLTDEAPAASTVVARAAARGVGVFAFGPRAIRVVVHRDLSRPACLDGAAVLADCIAEGGR